MEQTHMLDKGDPFTVIRQMKLADVEQRLADLNAERAALALLRRSLAARDRAKRRLAGKEAHRAN